MDLSSTYLIKPGDSLWTIAQHHFGLPGSSDRAILAGIELILDLNQPLKDRPGTLSAGQPLTLPPAQTFQDPAQAAKLLEGINILSMTEIVSRYQTFKKPAV